MANNAYILLGFKCLPKVPLLKIYNVEEETASEIPNKTYASRYSPLKDDRETVKISTNNSNLGH